MKLQSVSVEGLFGIFNHEFTLHGEDRVTIVHGPNGYGKTVVLNMLAAVLRGQTDIFDRVPFREFRVSFTDGTSRVVRKSDGPVEPGAPTTEFLYLNNLGHRLDTLAPPKQVPYSVLALIDESAIPSPFRLRRTHWVGPDGRRYSLQDMLDRYPAAARFLPAEFAYLASGVEPVDLPVTFIETNRLRDDPQETTTEPYSYSPAGLGWVTSEPKSVAYRVDSNAQDLKQRINATLADYAKHSQDRDRTLPQRLVTFLREHRRPLAPAELLERMFDLERKRERLVTLGILDSEVGLSGLTEEDVTRASEALTIYVGDVTQKLTVFDDLLQRIGTFRDIINDRLPYKSLTIDRSVGMRVHSFRGHEIKLSDLSSGEQHQLVVLYELLFRTPRNGLVLVDEPEISLHVAWQNKFLNDLLDILRVTQSYAIVATHSPFVIGSRWDLTVELTGPDFGRMHA